MWIPRSQSSRLNSKKRNFLSFEVSSLQYVQIMREVEQGKLESHLYFDLYAIRPLF